LSRDCRQIVASNWYRQLFATRLSAQRQAMSEFETTAQGCRLATSVGGVLTGRGADLIIDDPLKPEEALSQSQRQAANDWFDHTLYAVMMDNRLADHRPEPGHTIGEPLGNLSTVQRQVGGSSSLGHQPASPSRSPKRARRGNTSAQK
jgi:hypothetical protein